VKIGRIVQLSTLGVVLVYIGIVQNANPAPLALPGLVPLPLWMVLLLTAVAAFLSGWVPAALRGWRRGREARRLERRVAELESHVPSYDRLSSAPIIPDRVAEPEPGDGSEASSGHASKRLRPKG
jgi:uncharacterized integral membrane protein